MKESPQYPSNDPYQNHIESILRNPESVNALDVSHLFIELGYNDFSDAFKKIIKAYKEKTGDDLKVEFIFSINDPKIQALGDRVPLFLKNLKSFIENRRYSKHIKSITVKGPAGTVDLEPNVFSSGITFELMED